MFLREIASRATYETRRFMHALTAGTREFRLTYQGMGNDALYNDYDSYAGRAFHYGLYERWYSNTMFATLDAYVSHLKARNGLYKKFRVIYNPVHRLVDIETIKGGYPGQIDWAGGLRTGAIPVLGADKTLIVAITKILKWSNFNMGKDPYVRGGAKKGDRFLKIIDDTERKRVRMELLDPYKVRDCIFDEVGNIKWIAIQYIMTDENGKDFIFREEIDRNEFRFWREYNLNAFDRVFVGIALREPDNRYPNPYGFVPVKHAPHIKEDDSPWGRVSFGGSINKFIELNDQAALAHDAARKSVEPIYVARGGRIPEQDAASRERDEIIVLNIPKDAEVTTITPSVDMVGMLGNIDRLLKEISDDNPQLALQGIRDKGAAPSGLAIENSYTDAAGALIAIQGNADEGLTGAVQMAISIGAYRGYEEFRMYDPVKSYERGVLDFSIKQRDVFVDRISSERRIQLLNESADKPTLPVVARDLEYSEEDIAMIMAAKSQATADAMRGLAQAAFDEQDEDSDEDDVDPTAEIEVA